MILAYRTVHNPVDFDKIIQLKWFRDRETLQRHQAKWRGDTWVEVTVDDHEENDRPVHVTATTIGTEE